jgi:hypothetical protein
MVGVVLVAGLKVVFPQSVSLRICASLTMLLKRAGKRT